MSSQSSNAGIATPMSSIATAPVAFNIVDINVRDVAKALQQYLKRGSQLTGVSLDDIDLGVSFDPATVPNPNLVDLIQGGMKLFDAMVWLSAGPPASHPLVQDATISEDTIPSMMTVARCVFYTYFFLLTQARYPATRKTENKPKVASFLTQIMGMKEAQHTYIEAICSFSPEKFNPQWIKYISFQGLGQEAMSRFGLGVAGYRLFQAFKLYNPKAGIPENLRKAVVFAKTIAMSEPTWAIHPCTRSPQVLQKRGNLNKNLGNLIREVFTAEQIAEMVESKVLYATPKVEPAYKNYQLWDEIDDISGSEKIFPAN